MTVGAAKWFYRTNVFCVIVPEEGSEDAFVHFSAIEGGGDREMAEGQRVRFEVARGTKGLRASAARVA